MPFFPYQLLTSPIDRAKYRSTLISLLNSQYIKPTAPVLQTSPRDRYLRYQKEAERKKNSAPNAKKGPMSAKDRMEINEAASKRLRDEVNSIESSGLVSGDLCSFIVCVLTF